MDDDGGRELELRDYVAVLRRRKWIIGLTTVAVVLAALALSLIQKPVYSSTAEVLLQPRASEQIFSPNQQQNATPDTTRVQTEIQVMQSRSVQDAVTQALGHPVAVDISAQNGTDVVAVTAEDRDPQQAATNAETYAETYVKVRREQTVTDLLDASTQIQQQIAKVDSDIAAATKPLNDLDTQIAAANDAATRASLKTQRDQLVPQVTQQQQTLQTRRGAYADQLDRLQLASNLTQTGGAQIVSKAQVPGTPVRPTPKRDAVIALFVGLLLGVGLALLAERLDDSIKSREDLDAVSGGLSLLSVVPAVESWKDRDEPELVSIHQPKSPAAEAYRALRTSVQFVGLEQPTGVIQVTSPSASEGKTTTLANLGVVLARAGKRVVMVDCDLRRPRIESFFGLPNEVGFTNVLVGDATLAQAVQRVPNEPRLAILPAGPPPPNPSELLTTKRAVELLNALREETDYILVDSPPLLPVADAVILAGIVDATIIVVTADTSTKRQTKRALELLRQVNAPLIGVVLNSVHDGRGGYGYSYGYGYAYESYSQGDARHRRRWPRRRRRGSSSTMSEAPRAEQPVNIG